eukprot:3431072-Ditylum_brightwellii.AAC.1
MYYPDDVKVPGPKVLQQFCKTTNANSEQEEGGKQQLHQFNQDEIGSGLLSLEEVIIQAIMKDALYEQHPYTILKKAVVLQNARIFHDSIANHMILQQQISTLSQNFGGLLQHLQINKHAYFMNSKFSPLLHVICTWFGIQSWFAHQFYAGFRNLPWFGNWSWLTHQFNT